MQDQDHDGMIDMADLSAALANAGIDMEHSGVRFLLEGERALCTLRLRCVLHSLGGGREALRGPAQWQQLCAR